MSEWSQFGLVFQRGATPKDASELETVYHIVHAKTCRRILEDERLRAGIIGDESVLKTTRISVVWTSANHWAYGSFYGNVRFGFDWARFAQGKNIYWVEAIAYGNPAYRLMVTDRNLANGLVTPYNPETDEGPLRKVAGIWYWNHRYTSEFMIDRDVSLREATTLDFVRHSRCRESRSCGDEKIGEYRIAGQVIAFILGNSIHCVDHLLTKEERLTSSAFQGLSEISMSLTAKKDCFGGSLDKDESVAAVLRGALALHGSGQVMDAKNLMKTIRTRDAFNAALERIIQEHFGIASLRLE
jgi:hypothetical protein